MSKCIICGKEIEGFGNNPWPICDKDDFSSQCCDNCNREYVLEARILSMRFDTNDKINDFKEGDEIVIFWLHEEPNVQEYILRKGKITDIDDLEQLHGTWGGLAIDPEVDTFCILK